MAVKIAKMSRYYDVIHGHWEISGFIWRISNIKKLNNGFLLTLRGENIEYMRNTFIKRLISNFSLKNSFALTSDSDHLSIKLKEILHSSKIFLPVYTMREGVDKRFFSLLYPPIIHPIRILYIGSLISRKRVDILIKACKISLDKGALFNLTIIELSISSSLFFKKLLHLIQLSILSFKLE